MNIKSYNIEINMNENQILNKNNIVDNNIISPNIPDVDDSQHTYDIISPNMFGSGLHSIPDLDTYLKGQSLSKGPTIKRIKVDNMDVLGDIYWNDNIHKINGHIKAKVNNYTSHPYFNKNDWIHGVNSVSNDNN